jgi:hypothetical protein
MRCTVFHVLKRAANRAVVIQEQWKPLTWITWGERQTDFKGNQPNKRVSEFQSLQPPLGTK